MHPFIAEIIGTGLLVLLGDGVVANVVLSKTKGHGSGWIVITFGWGMGVFIAVFTVAAYSGAHINPAVTLGMAIGGKLAWASVIPYIVGQMIGGFLAAVLVWLFYRDHYNATEDPDLKLATFCTGPNIRNLPTNFLCEVVGTFVLVFPIFMIAEPVFQLPTTSGAGEEVTIGLGALGALPVGLLVFAIGLSLGGTTGYAINPARDLGPRLAHAVLPIQGKRDSDWGYAWVPVVAPLVGGALAALAALLVL